MKLHANAALSLNGRRRLSERVIVEEWTVTKAAEAAEVSVRTARKWVRRYRAEGEAGLLDRCSTPRGQPMRALGRLAMRAATAPQHLVYGGVRPADLDR